MASMVRLPYYATDIPCSLPTDAEIDKASDISLAYGGRRVVGVGDHFVVKFGLQVNLLEGQNMIFVRKTTQISVPRVYALYSNSDTKKNYIVMEKIAGQTLLTLWPQLSLSEKESVALTMKTYLDELQRLPSPNYYGSLDGGSLLDGVFWTREAEPAINGPFKTEDALNEAFARKYIYDGGPTYRAEFFRQCHPRIFRDHRPVFTHGDIQRKNIIVQREPNESGAEIDQKMRVVVLDWEKSGWYPSYWEYCLAVCALQWDDDWCLLLEKMMDPYVSEASWLQALRIELWS